MARTLHSEALFGSSVPASQLRTFFLLLFQDEEATIRGSRDTVDNEGVVWVSTDRDNCICGCF